MPPTAVRRGSATRPPAPPPAAADQHLQPPPPALSLCAPIAHPGLRWFRRLFLLALAYDSWCVASRGEMADFFGAPNRLNFVYPALPWVRPLEAHLMERLPHAIGASALLSLVMPRCGLFHSAHTPEKVYCHSAKKTWQLPLAYLCPLIPRISNHPSH